MADRPLLRRLAGSGFALLALAVLPLAAARPVAAHAVVMAAEPAVGADLAEAPAEARLRFNSRIDAGRSRLTLVAPDGGTAELTIHATADQPSRLQAALPRLAPGPWRLRWQVLAVDGHITRGEIPFRIHAP